jgi:hypothetical protein
MAQGLAERNGEDASKLGGYLNQGIPEGNLVNVRVLGDEEQEEAMRATFMR